MICESSIDVVVTVAVAALDLGMIVAVVTVNVVDVHLHSARLVVVPVVQRFVVVVLAVQRE